MAVYKAEQVGIKAPKTGFQEGGWYGGRQYIGGTLSEVGVIHPGSSQIGAGQAVSQEVNRQTSIAAGKAPNANQTFINNQQNVSGTSQTSSYLNDIGSSAFSSLNSTPTRGVPTVDELKSTLAPSTQLPALINRNAEMETLREKFGVADLEGLVTDLKAQEQEVIAQNRILTAGERNKPVAMNVIEGRVSEAERAASERLDAIGRQKARAVDELNTNYSIINQYMTNIGLDYNDAVQRYDSEFEKNVAMYNIVTNRQDKARDAFESDRAAASANLTTMVNLITNGNMDLSSLSTDDQLMLTKLEVQAGLPIGFMSSVKMDPKANVLFTTSNDGVTQIGFKNPDGTVSVQSYGTRTSGGGKETMQQAIASKMSTETNNEGHLDRDKYLFHRKQWVDAGGNPDDFDTVFRDYRDPYNEEQYQLMIE
jgi:hypothetical protein